MVKTAIPEPRFSPDTQHLRRLAESPEQLNAGLKDSHMLHSPETCSQQSAHEVAGNDFKVEAHYRPQPYCVN